MYRKKPGDELAKGATHRKRKEVDIESRADGFSCPYIFTLFFSVHFQFEVEAV